MKATIIISIFILMWGCSNNSGKQDITRIWLNYNTEKTNQITINWQSPEPGNSEVILFVGDKKVFSTQKDENVSIHHIEVPVSEKGVEYLYKVKTGAHESALLSFKSIPTKQPLKIAVIADWGYAGDADISNILKDNPAFIVTCGDNVPDLYQFGEEGNKHCINSYLTLVDSFPELFSHFVFMPAMGNHDHQLHPRGPKPPEDYMVYDTSATAFTEFFELPGSEWKWTLALPEYNLRFVTLDLHHIHDYGNHWQTCHAYHKNSEQYNWYNKTMNEDFDGNTITIMNANMPDMRHINDSLWTPLLNKSSIVISGSGYYAEKTIIDSTVYLNTSLIAGDVWPDAIDPKAEFSESISSYILLTVSDSVLSADIKTLDGKIYNQSIVK